METEIDILNDRTTVAILALLYSMPDGKMKRDELVFAIALLDVDNMTERQWRKFNRQCSRWGKWRRSKLYKWLHSEITVTLT